MNQRSYINTDLRIVRMYVSRAYQLEGAYRELRARETRTNSIVSVVSIRADEFKSGKLKFAETRQSSARAEIKVLALLKDRFQLGRL